MKTILSHLITGLFLILGICLLLRGILCLLPTNPTPCFGTAKDGRLRWHSPADCAHPGH